MPCEFRAKVCHRLLSQVYFWQLLIYISLLLVVCIVGHEIFKYYLFIMLRNLSKINTPKNKDNVLFQIDVVTINFRTTFFC